MPLYEYYCTDCRTTFEVLRPMSQADVPVPCIQCASQRTSRALSLFAAPSKGDNRATLPTGGTGGGCACGSGGCGCHH